MNSLNRKLFRLLSSLAISTALCVGMIFFRIYKTGSLMYGFYIWNLFLAWVPLLASIILGYPAEKKRKWFAELFFFSVWIGFFPNAPYLITDIGHLAQRPEMPFWFDVLLVVVAAWNGLMLGFISLYEIQKFLSARISSIFSKLIIPVMLSICSFGIYLGRFERWNTWDILFQPIDFIQNIHTILFHPLRNFKIFELVFLLSVFLLSCYYVLISFMRLESKE